MFTFIFAALVQGIIYKQVVEKIQEQHRLRLVKHAILCYWAITPPH
jgi:hypothetical protein